MSRRTTVFAEIRGKCGVCNQPPKEDDAWWVACDACDMWSHFTCVGVTDEVTEEAWLCTACDAKQKRLLREGFVPSKSLQVMTEALEEANKEVEEIHQENDRLAEEKNRLEQQNNELVKRLELKKSMANIPMPQPHAPEPIAHEPYNETLQILEQAKRTLEERERLKSRGSSIVANNNKILSDVANLKEFEQGNQAPFKPTHVRPVFEVMEPGASAVASAMQRLVLLQDLEPLPKFSGKDHEWPLFLAAYERSESEVPMSESRKLSRLTSALEGGARALVIGLLSYASSADDVMKVLRKKYGRVDETVQRLTEEILRTPVIPSHNKAALEKFATQLTTYSMQLVAMGQGHDVNANFVLNQLVGKLAKNVSLYSQWTAIKRKHATMDIADLADFLMEKVACMPSVHHDDARKEPNKNVTQKRTYKHATSEDESSQVQYCQPRFEDCSACGAIDNHEVGRCFKFKKMSPKERWDVARKARLCFVCLSSNHVSTKCPKTVKCKIDGCEKLHHTLLHIPKMESGEQRKESLNVSAPPYKPNAGSQGGGSAQISSHMQYSIKGEHAVISKVVQVRIHGQDGRFHDTHAFLDDGSELTLMERSVADKLLLKGNSRDLLMTWTNGQKQRHKALVVEILIEGAGTGVRYGLGGVHCIPNLDMALMSQPGHAMSQRYAHLRRLPLPDFTLVKPEVLIGLGHVNFLGGKRTIEGKMGEPIATKTKLGWVVYGQTHTGPQIREGRSFNAIHSQQQQQYFFNMHTRVPIDQTSQDEMMHDLVKQFFATESVGVNAKCMKSRDEIRAEEILESTMKKIEGRYEIGLLWKNDGTSLPDSLPMARKRLEAEERKLKRSGDLQWMNEHFRSLLEDGYARKATESDLATEWPRLWYVPMFVVVNHNKVPPKPRVVSDAAAREPRTGKSLNNFLLTGPDNLIPLMQALCRVREHRVMVNMDVTKMFHQVRIIEADQQCQRFLWRDGDDTKDPEVYVMQAMMFGPTCSPAAAQFVKNEHAKLYEKSMPEAAEGLQRFTYADDYFNSHATVEEAVRVTRDAIMICAEMGFELVQGQSNSREVLAQLPEGHVKAEAISLSDSNSSYSTKILGMLWQPEEDVLIFKKASNETRGDGSKPTKRQMLSILMRVFDPLGLAAKFVVRGKKVLQQVWREATGWDDEVSDEVAIEWQHFLGSLDELATIKIPRWYAPVNPNECEVSAIIFVDASESAYAAVGYLRFEHQGEVFVALAMAKTKVAPLKCLSIPRLELQAAVLGARLGKTIREMHSFKIENFFFLCDSSCVLAWIRRPTSKLNAFVSHRIAEIDELTQERQWFKVPTTLNVADDATKDNDGRGEEVKQRWFSGPDFLKEPIAAWPIQRAEQTSVEEEERVAFINAHLTEIPSEVEHFISRIPPQYRASWPTLTRVVARMLRLTSSEQRGESLTREELAKAEVVIFGAIQQEIFQREWNALHKWTEDGQTEAFDRGRLGAKSTLKSLPLIMRPGENVIRYANRDKHSQRLYGAKNPVLLPTDHELVHTLIRHHHEKNHHIGVEATIADIRERAWVISVRKALKTVTANCGECIRRKTVPIMPPIASLHEARTQSDKKPFLHVGVDCFGPIETKFGLRGKIKRWVVIFTCLTYRAVQLEVVEDSSASQILRAIRRLMVKRGPIACMYSDRGTNFVGANNVAKVEIERMQKLLKEDTSRKLNIDWHFNPAYSPWMGGAWERLISFIKKSLDFTFKGETPTDGILRDALSEAELLVNKRPLTHTPITPEDESPLTPNWFLFGANDAEQLIGEFHDSDHYSRDQRDRVRHFLKRFSERWQREYLPRIAQADSAKEPGRAIRVGDVVCIAEGNTPRSDWVLGRIEKVYPSADGIPRIVDVRLSNGAIKERRAVGNMAALVEESSAPATKTVGSVTPPA